jgi:hypothetical protein
MYVCSVSIEGSRRRSVLEMCTSSEQHGKWLICCMENPKDLCNQTVKYNVHNSMSCELYVGLFSIKLFFKENVRTANGNEQFPTCVVSNTQVTQQLS